MPAECLAEEVDGPDWSSAVIPSASLKVASSLDEEAFLAALVDMFGQSSDEVHTADWAYSLAHFDSLVLVNIPEVA